MLCCHKNKRILFIVNICSTAVSMADDTSSRQTNKQTNKQTSNSCVSNTAHQPFEHVKGASSWILTDFEQPKFIFVSKENKKIIVHFY